MTSYDPFAYLSLTASLEWKGDSLYKKMVNNFLEKRLIFS